MFRPFPALAAISLVCAGCVASTSAPTGTATRLVADGRVVNADFVIGPLARQTGSRGTGRFFYTYRAGRGEFGPFSVLAHDAGTLTARGTTTTCTFKRDRSVDCEDGSTGIWGFG